MGRPVWVRVPPPAPQLHLQGDKKKTVGVNRRFFFMPMQKSPDLSGFFHIRHQVPLAGAFVQTSKCTCPIPDISAPASSWTNLDDLGRKISSMDDWTNLDEIWTKPLRPRRFSLLSGSLGQKQRLVNHPKRPRTPGCGFAVWRAGVSFYLMTVLSVPSLSRNTSLPV